MIFLFFLINKIKARIVSNVLLMRQRDTGETVNRITWDREV